MRKYEVQIGHPFDVDILRAIERKKDGSVRRTIALSVVIGASCAVALSAVIGFSDGSFNELESVWQAVAAPMGYVFATYFGEPP